mgnify:CR=1 FL=1
MNWIDVNESLPVTGIDSVWVLVAYIFDGKQYVGEGKYIKTPKPYWTDTFRNEVEVTHWMPFPEPPSIFSGVICKRFL